MAEPIIAERASVAGHWYDKEGNPVYEVIGNNGKKRNTNLGDARKLGLLPSVTSIMNCAAKPGLQSWKDNQMIMACLTLPRIENEPEEAYIARIKRDADAHSAEARERGTLVHAFVQQGFEGAKLEGEALEFYQSALETVNAECGKQRWNCEVSFATYRYGGKIDLISSEYLIDIKTTEKSLDGIKTWDEHAQQLAAYDRNKGRKCGILYINVFNKQSKIIFIPEEEIQRGMKCFNALLDYWYAKTGLLQSCW